MFKRFFKRQVESNDVTEDATFVPFNTRGTQYSGAYSPVTARCLKMYSSFLAVTPLECDKDNSLSNAEATLSACLQTKLL